MKKKLLYIFCFIFYSILFSQNPDAKKITINDAFLSGAIHLKSSNESTVLVEDLKSGMFVKVWMDEKEYTFLVDSGFTISAIDTKVAASQSLDLKVNTDNLIGSQKEAELFKIDFSLENNLFKDFSFIKLDLQDVSEASCVKIDGILGMNVLKKLNWKLIKDEKRLYFSDSPYPYTGFSRPIEIQWADSYFPLAKMNIDNKEFYAGVDLGATSGLILSASVYKAIFKDYNKLNKGSGIAFQTVHGKVAADEVRKASVKSISLGELTLKNYNIIVSHDKPLLGQGILLSDNLILNFSKMEMAFGNEFSSKVKSDKLDSFGLCRSQKDDSKIELCFLWDDDKNFKKLKIGDQLIQVDSIDATSLSDSEFCTLQEYMGNKKGPRNVKFQRGDKHIDIVLN